MMQPLDLFTLHFEWKLKWDKEEKSNETQTKPKKMLNERERVREGERERKREDSKTMVKKNYLMTVDQTDKPQSKMHNAFSYSFSYLLNQSPVHYMDSKINFGQAFLLVDNRIHSLLPNGLPTFEPRRTAIEKEKDGEKKMFKGHNVVIAYQI